MGDIIKTAQCRFCGQMVQIETDKELTQPQAEEQATMTCNCTEAVEYQKEKQRKEKAMMNVSALFGENAAPDKRCGEGIVNILKAAVEEIYTGGLAKVTLNLRAVSLSSLTLYVFVSHDRLRRVMNCVLPSPLDTAPSP